MSTAELKKMIDALTSEERKWMTAYLLDQMFSVPGRCDRPAAKLEKAAPHFRELDE
jgi:hypothetical protein